MRIGTVREVKIHEYRVGMIPSVALELVKHGHSVMVETGAGAGIKATDDDYRAAGAEVVGTASEVFAQCDMVVKVKEPQPAERAMLREGQVLFTYLHLAPDPQQAEELINSGAICIAYETITANDGTLPLLSPMSQVAGRMSIQAGASALEKEHGGKGLLLGGVPGVLPGRVVILGGGVVGTHAAQMACGLGADVTIVDRSLPRLQFLDSVFNGRAKLLFSNTANVHDAIVGADLVVGSVLIPGAAAPKIVTREMVSDMSAGSVIVDVAIDQGGSSETSRPTTHSDPTYTVDDVVHYCVTNMPGGVARSSTYALSNATLPFTLALADKGWKQAIADDHHLREGVNVCGGKITHPVVAEALGREYFSLA